MQLCHDQPTPEHFSVDRTLDRIKQSFFWSNVHNDVVQWIKSRPQCNEFNRPYPYQTAASNNHHK